VREVAAVDDDAEVQVETGITALVFFDLDGVRRAVPLDLLDRIEQVDAGAIHFAAGRLRLTIDGRILPLVARGETLAGGPRSVLRLKDGETEIAYAIAEAADIVTLPVELVHAEAPGPVAAVALVDGEPVELIDSHWLFAAHAAGVQDRTAAPLCLLSDGDAGWMRSFVKPILEAAGYRVAEGSADGGAADVVLTLDADPAPSAPPAPVVRLRSQRGGNPDGSVYRYDRDGLLSAVANAARGA
jgi:two-component system chemotaxis sensor kinase CheA